MKIYLRIATVCVAISLLGGLTFRGAEGAQKTESPGGQRYISRAEATAFSRSGRMVGSAASRLQRAEELFRLGQIYFQGEEVVQDDEEAAYYYKKSAELGYARAQISIGMMYASGRGVQKDFEEAVYWIHQAAGFLQLSWRDPAAARAMSWLQAAAVHGYAPAQRTLELMGNGGRRAGAESDNDVPGLRKSSGQGDAGRRSARHLRLQVGLGGNAHAEMKIHGLA